MPTTAWGFYEALGQQPRDRLTETEREVAAILDLRQEVNSGGFDSYFRCWGGNTAPTALASLPAALGAEWAALLEEAMSLLGPAYPLDPDRRFDLIEERELRDALWSLDTKFYELEASIDADAQLTSRLLNSG